MARDSRHSLEEALLASWDRDTLAVYADHLQAAGDPRGELIALDLQIDHRSTPELVVRRASLLSRWLGMLVPSDPHAPWLGDTFRYGFVENLVVTRDHGEQRIAQVLASPLAAYLRQVTIRGRRSDIASALAQLAAVPHPWLRQLTIEQDDRMADPADPDPSDASALLAAAPNLDVLEVRGATVLASCVHPKLRALTVSWSALPGLFDGDAIDLPAVSALDLAFADRIFGPPQISTIAGRISLALPALRRLDLSRNEPAARTYDVDWEDEYDDDGGAITEDAPLTALDFLERFAMRKQLTQLVLPSIRAADQFQRLIELLSGMPALDELEVARGHYFRMPDLPPPLDHIVFKRPMAWPWPALDRIDAGDVLHVVVPDSRAPDIVSIHDAAVAMERAFEDLPADARYAWTRVWVFVQSLVPGKQQTFPADLLIAATESVDIATGGWRQLREELRYRRPLPSTAVVKVTRTRG
ncbi:MAG TPA: hypothetical protein VFQ53_28625 [Kofleriaceae bacterium]|nr:hypothetical protein [Kofleriaceae bacterium]